MKITHVKKINSIISTKRTSLSIINHIHVNNGQATFTNLDISISIPTDWKNGLYDKDRIDQLENSINDNARIIDFPGLPKIDDVKYCGSIENTPDSIIDFVSKDDARVALTGIYIDHGQKMVIATNGHILHAEKAETENSVIITVPFFKLCKYFDCNKIYCDSKGKLVFAENNDGVKIYGKAIDGPYPSWEKVIPDNKSNGLLTEDIKSKLLAVTKTLKPYLNKKTQLAVFKGSEVYARLPESENGAIVDMGINPFNGVTVGFNMDAMGKILKVAKGNIHPSITNIAPMVIKSDKSITLDMPARAWGCKGTKETEKDYFADCSFKSIPMVATKTKKISPITALKAKIKKLENENAELWQMLDNQTK